MQQALVDWATAKPLAAGLALYLSFLLVSLIALLGYHLRLVALGETTNERVKGVWKGKAKPHDRGCCGNYALLLREAVPPSRLPNMRRRVRRVGVIAVASVSAALLSVGSLAKNDDTFFAWQKSGPVLTKGDGKMMDKAQAKGST
mgnify:CR=1 FL=1